MSTIPKASVENSRTNECALRVAGLAQSQRLSEFAAHLMAPASGFLPKL
jgi:hypothetical protein